MSGGGEGTSDDRSDTDVIVLETPILDSRRGLLASSSVGGGEGVIGENSGSLSGFIPTWKPRDPTISVPC